MRFLTKNELQVSGGAVVVPDDLNFVAYGMSGYGGSNPAPGSSVNPADACPPLGIVAKVAPNPSTKQAGTICDGAVQVVDKAIDTTAAKIQCVENGDTWDSSSNSCKKD